MKRLFYKIKKKVEDTWCNIVRNFANTISVCSCTQYNNNNNNNDDDDDDDNNNDDNNNNNITTEL